MKYVLSILTILFFPILSFAEEPQVYSYSVKGIIKKLPAIDSGKKTIIIKHEKIPDYVGADGKATGMNAMTMPFSFSDEVKTENLQEGDCIRFNFDSWWKPKPADQITKIEKIECE